MNTNSENNEANNDILNDQIRGLFAKLRSLEERTISSSITSKYTAADLRNFVANPQRYRSNLIEINRYMYHTSSIYKNLVDYYVKMVLVDRWHVKLSVGSNYTKINHPKVKKDYLAYCSKIEKLNLKQELHNILLLMFLEDAVFGYWLEGEQTDTLFYLPSSWCVIKGKTNGLWSYYINTSVISSRAFELLPKKLQKFLRKYNGKAGDAALAPVPFNEGFCAKWNFHTDEIYPPMTSIIENIIRIAKYKDLDEARTELDAWTLVSMLIPMKDDEQNHLLLTADVISAFVNGAYGVVPPQVGMIPTPMKLESIPLNKNNVADKDKVSEVTNQYNKESGIPSALMGEGKSGSIVSLTIKKDSATVFNCLNQISDIITLKMTLDGYTNRNYSFTFKLMNMTVFNEQDVQKSLALNANQGSPNKFEWYASQGINLNQMLGQSMLENDIFADVFDSMTVLPSKDTHGKVVSNGGDGLSESRVPTASVNISDTTLGRPRLSIEELSPEGEATRENDSNNPATRTV